MSVMAFEELLQTPEPADLGPASRAGAQSQPVLNKAIENALATLTLTTEKKDLVRALILLWHDHLDAAHTIAQEIDNADGAFVHGIMHRREPDYGNAKYWFRRVGSHPAFAEMSLTFMSVAAKHEGIPSGTGKALASQTACQLARTIAGRRSIEWVGGNRRRA